MRPAAGHPCAGRPASAPPRPTATEDPHRAHVRRPAGEPPWPARRGARIIAARSINLASLGGAASGDRGALALLAENESGLREVLDSRGVSYSEMPVVTAALEDVPGAVASAARRLGDAGINIGAIFPTAARGTKVTVAFGVSDEAGARDALGNLAGG
jgi:hypothetical protein